MGLLDAWANAEKISYPVIGEEVKEASNVIDYNINEEVTTGTSSIFNANNDTTTGLATVIPGVNAPKLIESTSIYNNVVDWFGTCNVSGSGSRQLQSGDYGVGYIHLTLNSQEGPYEFKVVDHDFSGNIFQDISLILPKSGIYKFTVTYMCRVGLAGRHYNVYQNLENIRLLQNDSYYGQTGSAYPTEEFYVNGETGDEIMFTYYVYDGNTGPGYDTIQYSLKADVTKL